MHVKTAQMLPPCSMLMLLILLSVLLVDVDSWSWSGHDKSYAEPIQSGGIKTELGDCTIKKGPGGQKVEHCYIRNQDVEVRKYLQDERAKSGTSCKIFKKSDFDSSTPSIMYGESQGRLGNQLLGYAMLSQLR